MTTLRERLDRKIKSYANSIYPPIDPRWAGTENEAFKDGADMMLDLVCKLADALDELRDLMEGVCEGDYRPDVFTTQPARKALQELEQFIGDK